MSNSSDNSLHNLRPLVVAMMEEQGRDFTTCEYCTRPITDEKWEIHHTKYKGATYQDLMIVCLSCNRVGINVGLE